MAILLHPRLTACCIRSSWRCSCLLSLRLVGSIALYKKRNDQTATSSGSSLLADKCVNVRRACHACECIFKMLHTHHRPCKTQQESEASHGGLSASYEHPFAGCCLHPHAHSMESQEAFDFSGFSLSRVQHARTGVRQMYR